MYRSTRKHATAADPWSVTLRWPPHAGAATAEIVRDGRVVDVVAASALDYRDRLLWPQTTYPYEVRLRSSAGTELVRLAASAATPPQTAPLPRLYGPGSFVNEPIACRVVHSIPVR